MNAEDLITHLGYDRSSAFVYGESLNAHPGFSYAFRRAQKDCGLRGVYTLKDRSDTSLIPLIYVCEANDEGEARFIHRRVWNQNIVPFLVVVAPRSIRLYPGFRYQRQQPEQTDQALIRLLDATVTALSELDDFRSEAIDEGRIWGRWGQQVTPETRVDWELLEQLDALGQWLRERHLERHTAHALIGKFVYLRYLKDRGILSPRKLSEWGIEEDAIFGRNATLDGFQTVIERLEEWLNGSVFPLPNEYPDAIKEEHIRKLASVFKGDEVAGQMHLDFRRYDFAQIPIETLSVVYQQFLHAEGKGREKSAYYTPIHLVNFMLDELEGKRPLKPAMKVLDPACGSGAFLVQCYRRLIERRFAKSGRLRPMELREILTKQIFGMDQDKDACQVAGLSLVLTLLDYIDPPDLKHYPSFKIPPLYDRNIIEGDFFKAGDCLPPDGFDWIVSNPPWKELKAQSLTEDDRAAFDWMNQHRKEHPVGGYQLAEAFAWKITEHIKDEGVIALLVPAMTLFKSESETFRRRFFEYQDVWTVVNFANLAYILFAGRSQVPAAVLFYSPARDDAPRDSYIDTYAPFLVNQQASIKSARSKRSSIWNIVVNGGELRQVEVRDAVTGSSLPWKIAMWGSERDRRLLGSIKKRFPTFHWFCRDHGFLVHSGIELRASSSSENKEFVEELVGKKTINMDMLREERDLFAFPRSVFNYIEEDQAHVRKGRVSVPLSVCRPPHIIVDAARRFAVYSDEFLVVPARQIGIAGRPEQAPLLKALALFLSSDFVIYHQIFHSAQWGVQKSISNKENLEQLPTSLDRLGADELRNWAVLHDQLAQMDQAFRDNSHTSVFAERNDDKRQLLLNQLNDMIFDLLNIKTTERYLVEDLVHYRLRFNKGVLDQELMKPPEQSEVEIYAEILRSELDAFLGEDVSNRHRIHIYRDCHYAVLEIGLIGANAKENSIQIREINSDLSDKVNRLRACLRRDHQQWIYFERNLMLFDGPRTYFFKPMQRLQWLRSQALIDADDLIADTLAADVA